MNEFKMERQYKIFNICKLSLLKWNFKTPKTLITLFNKIDSCFVTNIPDIE